HDRDKVAFLNVYVNAAKHEGLGGAVLEEFFDVAEPDHLDSPRVFCWRIFVTAAGSACPRLAFITWPRKKFITVVFPLRYCSSCLGFAAITSSMILPSASSSLICVSPSRFMIVSAGSPVANIFGKTSLASLPLIFP